ncbi:MAG: serine hydrolase [Betaproteobacteria bacterium]|nr:MAG: serine hydrolase [Betaproteobacteria bacterium]
MKRVFLTMVAVVLLPAQAAAPYQRLAGIADDTEPLIVAGYRALFTCSAHFFAGRPLDDIKKIELVDVEGLGYPDPVIDRQRRIVTAADGTGKIVRMAAFRDSMGCTLLPPDWSASDVASLPFVAYTNPRDVSSIPFPDGDQVELPSDGVDAQYRVLQPVIDRAFSDGVYAATRGVVTTSVLIAKDGELIAERYLPGFGIHSGYRTWSTAKSISAALIGVAHRKQILNIDDPAAIPEWADPGDPRQMITYKHLLWMSSGLFSGGSNTNAIYFGGQDVISAATTTPLEVQPGKRWKYANNDTLILLRALRHRIGDDLLYLRFPYDELLHPLGMYHTRMEIDHLGNFVGSSQTYTTGRDLMRFGLFLANDGVWNGRRILPEGWMQFSTTPAPARPSRSGQWGYGAQFWLLDRMPGVPKGTYTTAGNKGQYVTVVPDHNLVIVRTGVDRKGTRFLQHAFAADVVTALTSR